MSVEEKFKAALVRVLDDGTFKSQTALCAAAGADQGGVSRFIQTAMYNAGKGKKPRLPKENLTLDVVSRLVEAMGGDLVFPWDEGGASASVKVKQLELRLEEAKKAIADLERDMLKKDGEIEGYLKTIVRLSNPDSSPIPQKLQQKSLFEDDTNTPSQRLQGSLPGTG